MKKYICLLCTLIGLLSLSGCSDTSELDTYYDEMNKFNSNVSIITETMELIDENDETAPAQVVEQLEKLEEQFEILSEIEVPKHFSANEEMADDAYTYMQEAVRLYKEWYTAGDYEDTSTVQMAEENYNRAMTRVNYISIVLQGEIPQDEGIEVTEEDGTDFTPVTDEDSEDDYYEENPEDDYEIVDEFSE